MPRATYNHYRGIGEDGRELVREDGVNARVVLHDFDHLNAVIYPQRISDITKFAGDLEAVETSAGIGQMDGDPAVMAPFLAGLAVSL